MAVGHSGLGKSKIVEVLQRALSSIAVGPDELTDPMIGQPHREVQLNPKAITSPQMFGSLDIVANEWTEGIFAQLWRKYNRDKKTFTWLILDGPVDAIWIENMNTVMDDNRILTLANNDRIPMLRPNVTLHFEVEDLRNASPATVSRAGIIYISEADLGYSPMVTSWIKGRPKDGAQIQVYLDKYIQFMLDFLKKECRPKMSIADISLCTSMCTLIDSMLKDLPDAPNDPAIERFVIYALIWSIAGVLEAGDRAKAFYEYRVDDSNSDYAWSNWGSVLPKWVFRGLDLSKEFASLLIPTIDSVRTEHNISLSIRMNRPIILVGGPGTAKTSIILQASHTIHSVIDRADPSTISFKKLSFSAATTPQILQRQIEACVEKRQGKTFGPPGGKKMYVFIDDFSMPLINNWGDQITLELMRQLVERTGFYNLDKPGEWKFIVDLVFLTAMLHPGGGKNDVPNRAKRHFHVMNVTLPSVASINQIFGAMSEAKFADSERPEVIELSRSLVPMTIAIWEKVKTKMLPTPAKFHYLFNLRDLSRVFQGIFAVDVVETLTSSFHLLALWKHECTRVFSDKLVDHQDKSWFGKELFNVLDGFSSSFAADISMLKEREQSNGTTYFVDFLRPPGEDPETGESLPAPKVYEPVEAVKFDEVRKVSQGYMGKFNETYKLLRMELVFFHDALEHLCRITRLFGLSRGSALLVGVGGSGKQSLTRLAAFIANSTCFQITLTKTYNTNNLLEDFKPLYRRAGIQNKPVCFMLTDKEIKDEAFLEYINIFLNTGELPNLFPRDELEAIIGEMGEKYLQIYKNAEPTPDLLWTFFIERVRQNLHLSLCFSPVGVKFRTRAQQFPGLVNGCTIDWFLPWPEQALSDVATAYIGKFKELRGDAEVRSRLIKHMAYVHSRMAPNCVDYFERYRRNVYVTPKSYLGFIDEYQKVYVKKLEHISVLADSINVGLEKLLEGERGGGRAGAKGEGAKAEVSLATRQLGKVGWGGSVMGQQQ
ncbi:MAG: hypothetical protein SGPRY_005486 [Prymnesium sp.]